MRIKQRYWFMLAFVVVMLSIGVGVLTWQGVLSLQNTMHQQWSKLAGNQTSDQTIPSHPATPVATISVQSGARLLIPAIGVDAPIETVATDAQGHMGVPVKNRWNGVGWYEEGPNPGQRGSSVLDGHLDKVGGAPAVFWNLHKLHAGDLVSVQDKAKHTLHFLVTKVTSYSPANAPLEQIFARNDGNYLNLITCAGSWSNAEDQYSQRLVVFSRLVS